MDKFFAAVLAIPSVLYLTNDYNNRRHYTKLIENGTDDTFNFNSSLVVSSEPLTDPEKDSLIGKETDIKLQTFHTRYHDLPIYSDKNIKINIPISDTTIEWITNTTHRKFADNITLSNNPDSVLYLGPETKIKWDRTNDIINNNIMTTEKYLYNNVPRAVFGNMIDKNINVKYIGTENFVKDNIRSDHYGINNWLTTIASITLTLSTGWILKSFAQSKSK